MKRKLHKNVKVKRGLHGLGLFAADLIKKRRCCRRILGWP